MYPCSGAAKQWPFYPLWFLTPGWFALPPANSHIQIAVPLISHLFLLREPSSPSTWSDPAHGIPMNCHLLLYLRLHLHLTSESQTVGPSGNAYHSACNIRSPKQEGVPCPQTPRQRTLVQTGGGNGEASQEAWMGLKTLGKKSYLFSSLAEQRALLVLFTCKVFFCSHTSLRGSVGPWMKPRSFTDRVLSSGSFIY